MVIKHFVLFLTLEHLLGHHLMWGAIMESLKVAPLFLLSSFSHFSCVWISCE